MDPTIIGTIAGQMSNKIDNFKDKVFNLGTYFLQRHHNRQDWHRQNEYNHPKNQIARMKEAGLNPAMMYGSGSSAGGAAAPVPSPDMPKYDTPQQDPFAMLTSFQGIADLKIKEQQLNNLKEQEKNIQQDTALKAANELLAIQNRYKAGADTNLKQYDLYYKGRIEALQLDALRLKNDQLTKTIQSIIDSNARAWQANTRAWRADKRAESNLNSLNALREVQTALQKNQFHFSTNDLKNMAEKGVPQNAPWFMKMIANILSDIMRN